MATQKTLAVTGNILVAEAIRQAAPDVIPAYPITPQTTVVEELAKFVANGKMHAEYVNVESEHSAMSAAVGASAAGARVAPDRHADRNRQREANREFREADDRVLPKRSAAHDVGRRRDHLTRTAGEKRIDQAEARRQFPGGEDRRDRCRRDRQPLIHAPPRRRRGGGGCGGGTPRTPACR